MKKLSDEEAKARYRELEERKADIDAMIQKVLLNKFIHGKLNKYIEPKRKGTPKGEPIGFSNKKYKATLLLLQKANQSDVARLLNISHGLLRKWNTEREFKRIFQDNCLEFAEYVVAYLKKSTDERDKSIAEIMKGSIKNLIQYTPPHGPDEILDLFKDYKFYHVLVKNAVTNALVHATDQAMKDNSLSFKITLLSVLRLFEQIERGGKLSQETIKAWEKLGERIKQEAIIKAKQILVKKKISDRERKEIILFLNALKEAF